MTTNDQEYNGWKNYETWNVALWINNDQGLQETVRDMARECVDNEHANYDLSHAIKDLIEEMNPLNDTADLFTDILNAALSEVDWDDLAESFFKDIKE
jgi:hypothetical protein